MCKDEGLTQSKNTIHINVSKLTKPLELEDYIFHGKITLHTAIIKIFCKSFM